MRNEYAKKLRHQQTERIVQERSKAAVEAMSLLIVALNEAEGINLGPERLKRVAAKFDDVRDEYDAMLLKDPEYAHAKLAERIDKIMGVKH